MTDINPHYIAYMQGGDYIINAKIDDLPVHVENNIQQPGQYFIKIWIQYKNIEWEVNYNRGWVGCLNKDESYLVNKTFKKGDSGPIKTAKINLDDLILEVDFPDRGLNLQFKENFFKNNPKIKEYLGGIISKYQLRYLDDYKQILI